jgi:hypothetical protein
MIGGTNSKRIALSLAGCVALSLALGAWLGGRASADEKASKRIVYLFVTGKGPVAKAWYDGGPPTGVQVQSALDRFAAEGFRTAALVASGTTADVRVGTTAAPSATTEERASDYVILLER